MAIGSINSGIHALLREVSGGAVATASASWDPHLASALAKMGEPDIMRSPSVGGPMAEVLAGIANISSSNPLHDDMLTSARSVFRSGLDQLDRGQHANYLPIHIAQRDLVMLGAHTGEMTRGPLAPQAAASASATADAQALRAHWSRR